MRIDQLQQDFDLDCRYRTFPLHPETPQAGMSLEQLFGERMDVPAVMEQLRRIADSLGLPFGRRSHTYNSRSAQELGHWAARQGQFKNYQDAIYSAYFVEGINIADRGKLLSIVEKANLDPAEADNILQNGSCAAAVDRDWDQAVSSGIRAVPTLRCEGRELVGFQSLEACRQLICG